MTLHGPDRGQPLYYERGQSSWDPSAFPSISLVIPSYNQGGFIEETILSVLNQGYPKLEVHVIDGGSSDGSVEVIRKYEDRLASWCSEPDGGQARAVRKGFERSTGEILCFLNSDDLLLPGALQTVGAEFRANPEMDWLAGGCIRFASFAACRPMVHTVPKDLGGWVAYCPIYQPSTFWTRRVYDRLGPYPVECRYSHDWHFWLMLAFGGTRCHRIDRPLAAFRVHPESVTESQQEAIVTEDARLRSEYLPRLSPLSRWRCALSLRWLQSGSIALEASQKASLGDHGRAAALLRESVRVFPPIVLSRTYRNARRNMGKASPG